jgi:hypothetical protein
MSFWFWVLQARSPSGQIISTWLFHGVWQRYQTPIGDALLHTRVEFVFMYRESPWSLFKNLKFAAKLSLSRLIYNIKKKMKKWNGSEWVTAVWRFGSCFARDNTRRNKYLSLKFNLKFITPMTCENVIESGLRYTEYSSVIFRIVDINCNQTEFNQILITLWAHTVELEKTLNLNSNVLQIHYFRI